MHAHVSTLNAVTVACYVVIFGALWRTVATKLADTPTGAAMNFIF